MAWYIILCVCKKEELSANASGKHNIFAFSVVKS